MHPKRGNKTIVSPPMVHLKPYLARASIASNRNPMQLCKTCSLARLYASSPRMPSATLMCGMYPTVPMVSGEEELVFITCTWIGVQLRAPKPVCPPSQLMLNAATRPERPISYCALRKNALYWKPPPKTSSPVSGWCRVAAFHCNDMPASCSALHLDIQVYTGSIRENFNVAGTPGKPNGVILIRCVVVTASQKGPAFFNILALKLLLERGQRWPRARSPISSLTTESTVSRHAAVCVRTLSCTDQKCG